MPAWRAEAIKAAIGEGLAMAQEEFAKQASTVRPRADTGTSLCPPLAAAPVSLSPQETLLNAAGLWKPGPPGSLQMVSQESAFFDGAATLDFKSPFISSDTYSCASQFCCCLKPIAELVLLAGLAQQKGWEGKGEAGRHIVFFQCLCRTV